MSDNPKCPKCGADTAKAVDRNSGRVYYRCMKLRMGCTFMGPIPDPDAEAIGPPDVKP